MAIHDIVPPTTSSASWITGRANRIAVSSEGNSATITTENGEVWIVNMGYSAFPIGKCNGMIKAISTFDRKKSLNAIIVDSNGIHCRDFRIFDRDELRRIARLSNGRVWAVAPGCSIIVAASENNLIVHHAPKYKVSSRIRLGTRINGLSFSRDGSRLVGISEKGLICWRTVDWKSTAILKPKDVRLFSVDPTGKYVGIIDQRNRFSLVDIERKRIVRKLSSKHFSTTESIELARNADHLIALTTESKDTRWLRIFDLKTLNELSPLKAHNGKIEVAGLGETYLVTVSTDGEVLEWPWDITVAHLEFRQRIRGRLAPAYRKARQSLLRTEHKGLRMRSTWEMHPGHLPKQCSFELRDRAEEDEWREVIADRKPSHSFVLRAKETGVLYDVCRVWRSPGIVVSQAFLDALTKHRLTGWTAFPVTLRLPHNRKPECQYYGLAITGRIGPRVKYMMDSRIDMSLFIDVNNWDGSDFFCTTDGWETLVTEKVLDILTNEGITGWTASPITETSAEYVREAPLPKKKEKPKHSQVQPSNWPEPPRIASQKILSAGKFAHLIKSHGLEKFAKKIKECVRNSIRFNLRPAKQGALAIGATRLGGQPDLPESVKWPRHRKRPMVFMGQLRLADFAALDIDHALPQAGLLSFFLGPDAEPEDSIWCLGSGSACKLIYAPQNETLQRFPAPDDLPSTWELNPCELIVAKTLTLPHETSYPACGWGMDTTEMDAYSEMRDELESAHWNSGCTHRLLGWPTPQLQGDVLAECMGIWNESKAFKTSAWRMLLQIDSDSELGIQWGDAGYAYFAAPAVEMRKGDFSKTRCIAQF